MTEGCKNRTAFTEVVKVTQHELKDLLLTPYSLRTVLLTKCVLRANIITKGNRDVFQ